MSRAEKFLEGFKLGDLGAGKTKFASSPEIPAEIPVPVVQTGIRILKEEEQSRMINGKSRKLPLFYWVDPDTYAYTLTLEYRPEHGYFLIDLSCGSEIPTTRGVWTAWRAYSQMSQDYDEMLRYFEKLVTGVKAEGFKSIKLANFDIRPSYMGKYRKWLKERRQKSKT